MGGLSEPHPTHQRPPHCKRLPVTASATASDSEHRRKMERKAERRATEGQGAWFDRQLFTTDGKGKRTPTELYFHLKRLARLPIWPKRKVAKPGRMG